MEFLLPDLISLSSLLILLAVSSLAAFITAAMGIGGGVLLLATMASLLPVSVLIPVHGLVQAGSNSTRALLTRQHTDWQMVGYFVVGALLGAVCASFVVVQLPLQWIRISVAVFILYLAWGPKPGKARLGPLGRVLLGALTTLISMFVGATGPLVAGIVHRQSYDKLATVATFATCMSVQHLLKLLVFTLAGFAFWQWLPLIMMLIMAGFAGTWLGLRVLHRVPAHWFRQLFRLVVTLLALRLLWQGLAAF